MSDNPTGQASTFLRKKIMGVPALYLLGAVAVVLAVYAWRTKATTAGAPAATTAAPTGTAGVTTAGDAASGTSVLATPSMSAGAVGVSPYAALLPTTTAYAGPGQSVPTADATPQITSNEEWLSQGVAFLVSQGNTGGSAQSALQTYLMGGQLSMAQGAMRDAVIKQYGIPPFPPDTTGAAANPIPAPAPAPTGIAAETDPRRVAIIGYYHTYLHRDPSLSELNYWDASGQTLQQIHNNIASSPEAGKASY